MLSSLFISNYALIEKMDIEFGSSLNIITGETGAGKSIVLGALGLLMGERADFKTIRNKDKKTIVEAHFDVSNKDGLDKLLEQNDIDFDSELCILRREISPKGQSRAFINDTPVNLNLMKIVSTRLIDIHSQNENQLLVDPDFQLSVLDTLADNKEIFDNYQKAFFEYRRALKEFSSFRENLNKGRAENEYNIHLLNQLKEAKLEKGEQARLEQERDIVANATLIKEHLSDALEMLSRKDNDIVSELSVVSQNLEKIADYIDNSNILLERLESARIEIADIAETLEEYDRTLNGDPQDLERIERRLGEIYTLQARHNVDSVEALLDKQRTLESNINNVENGDEMLRELEEKAKKAKKEAVVLARNLSETRLLAAQKLGKELSLRAKPMGMQNLLCEIRVTQDKLKNTGIDSVDFLFAFNKNQILMPVGKTASGGEKSRLILAIKSLLVEKMQLPTIVFDEVDTGVSGDVANKMAEAMAAISKRTQVITITHIPTVAARGDNHFKVYKQDDADSTNTYIKTLNQHERISELAAMISGNEADENSIRAAESLLKTYHA